jgi:FAD linked oxidases, C-terminal domain
MRLEYDDTAFQLMRSIKAGIDPKGIMNRGVLLPMGKEVPAGETATIDLEKLKENIVRPGITDGVMQAQEEQPRKSNEKASEGSWFNRFWSS